MLLLDWQLWWLRTLQIIAQTVTEKASAGQPVSQLQISNSDSNANPGTHSNCQLVKMCKPSSSSDAYFTLINRPSSRRDAYLKQKESFQI